MVGHFLFEGDSIGEAYSSAISNLEFRDSLTFEITTPVDNLSAKPVRDVDDFRSWRDCLHFGSEIDIFRKQKIGDKTGERWIDQQFSLHTSGEYQKQAEQSGLERVRNELKDRGPGGRGSAEDNKLVIPLWNNTQDILEEDCSCLTQLQFKPQNDSLHLYAIFRSQALYSKAPGNLLGLAAQLATMCDATNFEPGNLISTAHNIPNMNNQRTTVREAYTDTLE